MTSSRPILRSSRSPDGGVVHGDAGLDELHQILVGGNDGDVGAGRHRLPGVSGDEIVGLVDILFDGLEPEGAHGLAKQRKLRHEIFWRLGAIGLVCGIDFLAKGVFALVENDGEMGRLDPGRAVADELQQLGAEQANGAGRQPVVAEIIFLVLPDRLEKGAKDEVRAIDEKDMVAGGEGAGYRRSCAFVLEGRAREQATSFPLYANTRGRPKGRKFALPIRARIG